MVINQFRNVMTSAEAGPVVPTPADLALLDRLMNVGDPDSDAVVDDLFAHGQVERVNALLHDWKANGQPLPDGLPDKVAAFLTAGLVVPAWADQAAISRAQRFEQEHAIEEGITAALHTTIGRVRMPMEMSAIDRAVDLNDAELFAGKAAQLLVGFYQAEPFGPSGQLLVDILKTRMMHSAVRYLLRADDWDHARWGTPINQITFLQNWTMFTNAAYDTLPKFGTTMTPQEQADHLHLWRVYGAMLGMPLDILPTTVADSLHIAAVLKQHLSEDSAKANAQSQQAIDAVAKIVSGPAAPVTRPFVTAFVRYIIGDEEADHIHLARDPLLDSSVKVAVPAAFTTINTVGASGLPRGGFNDILFTLVQRWLEREHGDVDLPMNTSLIPAPNTGHPTTPAPART
ncbi:oxygenase MpaB family protein [Streptomyces sp. wa53]|uniref:oxygenase MpaB family protein n=1 Tax=Streptomyces sp. wa53 TaxID=1828268 RepID=UPI003C7E08AA